MQLDRQFPGWEQRDPLVLWFPMFFHHFSGIVNFLVRKVTIFDMFQVKRQMGCSGKHINYCRISSIPKNETESNLLPYHSNLNYFLGKTWLFAKSLTGHYLKVMFSPRENNEILKIYKKWRSCAKLKIIENRQGFICFSDQEVSAGTHDSYPKMFIS